MVQLYVMTLTLILGLATKAGGMKEDVGQKSVPKHMHIPRSFVGKHKGGESQTLSNGNLFRI
jgi:hypothetical protein